MALGSLFNSKKSKKDEPEKTNETPEVTNDPLPSLEQTESPRISKANAVFPFHDVKATSFPPPLSIDASVYTEAENTAPEETEISKEPSAISKNAKYTRESPQANEKTEIEPCDKKTCPKDGLCLDSCEKSKKQHETKSKTSDDRLTEMINLSIKEAFETIAKQCRMDDAERYPEKRPKEEFAKSVCHSRESWWETKRERPRSAEEYFKKFSQKPSGPRDKRKGARTCPKKIEVIDKCRCKKVVPCEGTKTKKQSKSSSGKTDNRRMTGNVNIYICSEATENAQPVNKQKKPPPCAESSSETTTEPSNASSCKLATRLYNKRRKRKEQQSSDFLRRIEDSSDPSDPCSCDSKFSDVAAESESTVCAQDTESTSTDCRCKDEQVRSDRSIESESFVICDKAEDPCSSKMSSISDNENWSSKSCSGAETVLCDQAHREFDDRTTSPKSNYGDYYSRSLQRDQDSGREACRARKEDACKCQGGFRSKRRLSKTREPWSTCSCIAEEDEGDVCVTEESPKLTVCQSTVDSDLRRDSEDKRKSMDGVGDNADEQIEGKQEDGLDRRQSSLTSRKLRRPEALTLKQLIQQGKRPAVDQTITIPPSEGMNDAEPPVGQAREKGEPAFMKKFNLRDKDRFLKHLKDFQASDETKQNRKSGGGEETEGKKNGEKEEDEEDDEGKKGFPGRLRNSFLNTLRRVSGREKDTITEKDSDNRTEAPEKITDEQSVKDEGTQKGKRMSLSERLDINKLFKKKDKSADKKKPPSKMKGKRSAETDSEIKSNTDEGTEKKKDEEKKEAFEVPEEPVKQLPLPADVASKNPVPKPPDIEETKETVPADLPGLLTSQDTVKINPRDIQEESNHQKETGDREKNPPDAKNLEESRKIKEIREENTEVCPGLKKVSVTVCSRRPQEKPSTKESRQPACRRCSREPEVRTVCTNQQFPACTNADRSNERIEDSRCNCCCVPAPQSCSRLSNYPKSCLKKERPFCRKESQENNCSVLYRDNRSWEECGCRRIILCERCCRPRNECSCRPVPPCVTCYKPKAECICNTVCPPRSTCRRPKSMVCLYCDSPRESCSCRAPIRKCSCCDLAVDLCCCEENLKSVQGGRPVATEPECDRTIYVTAWKPREDVRRYFSRNLNDLRHDSINECCCHEKPKSQNSDDLPYQRLSCFSDVMNELQRKISESVCCTQCRKIPCCCNLKVDEGRDEKKIKYCVSPKSRRKVVAVCTDKLRSKSPTICKCDPQSRTDKSKKIVICCVCKSSPCRCKKPKSKKPRMKCYYCKNSPCVCITARERSSKPRPCRCADSPCRGKEKEITVCGKTSAKPKNNEEKISCVR